MLLCKGGGIPSDRVEASGIPHVCQLKRGERKPHEAPRLPQVWSGGYETDGGGQRRGGSVESLSECSQ